jgi:hypothetical protein
MTNIGSLFIVSQDRERARHIGEFFEHARHRVGAFSDGGAARGPLRGAPPALPPHPPPPPHNPDPPPGAPRPPQGGVVGGLLPQEGLCERGQRRPFGVPLEAVQLHAARV